MDARTLSTISSAGRIALGGGLLLAPKVFAKSWVGADADRPGAQVLSVAMGARDLAIGVGQLLATRKGFGAGPWVQASLLADAADLVATLRHRDDLPTLAGFGVPVIAGSALVIGAYLLSELD